MDAELQEKARQYARQKARTKELLALKNCTICGAEGAKRCRGCGTTSYCSTACQRIDWRDRGHRKVCKEIAARAEARAEGSTPPPRDIFYGPAPRSHADEVRARIAAEHEAARAAREAEAQDSAPDGMSDGMSARFGPRCPICLEDWDVNYYPFWWPCCCEHICESCSKQLLARKLHRSCPICRTLFPDSHAGLQEMIRPHVRNEVPEALYFLAKQHLLGINGVTKNPKMAVKIYGRAVKLGNVSAMTMLAQCYRRGEGITQNVNKAMHLYLMAAEQRDVRAKTMLGQMLWKTKDYKEALIYYAAAANQGYTEAEFFYGTVAIKSIPLNTVNTDERLLGVCMVARAAAKGHKKAIDTLALLDREEVEAAAEVLRSETGGERDPGY